MTQPRSLGDRLRAVPDPKARGRLRVAEVVSAHRNSGLSWVGANGWTFVLDAPPDVHLSPKDSNRAAARFDLTVRDGARVVFRDRILAWDGTPVLVPDGTKRTEFVDGLLVEVDNFREDPVAAARMDIEHTVRVVTKDGTQPHIKAKPGTVSTFYSGTADGYVRSSDTTYSTARSGSNLATNTAATDFTSGQLLSGATYFLYEPLVQWDTSAIGTDIVSAAALSLWAVSNVSDTEFTSNVRLYDWGVAITTADWIAGASLGGQTLLATFASAGVSTGAYNTFTEVALAANINTSGATRIVIGSSEMEAGNAPAAGQHINWSTADTAGTTQDPKLVVTHAAAMVVTPTTASLTTATFAPTVTASDNKLITPSTLATVLASFAPTILNPQGVTPATLATLLSALEPTVSVGQRVTPDAASLVLTTFDPTVINPMSATPDTLALTLSAFEPVASVGQIVTPDTIALLTVAFAPLILLPNVATPGLLELLTATFAPTVPLGQSVTPDAGALVLAAFEPTIVTTANLFLTPDVASLVIVTFAPTLIIPVTWPRPKMGAGRFLGTPDAGSGRFVSVKHGAGRFFRLPPGSGR